MGFSNLNKVIARLILLQRIELANTILKKIRKIFGRYIFTNIISRFLVSKSEINSKYYLLMNGEYNLLKKYINFDNKNILSIGPGMCGLEIIINTRSINSNFTILEKNYISKKIIYGWDSKNQEGYNDLNLLKGFLENNKMLNNFEIYNVDKDTLPEKKFDYIISLYSMDYHYDFTVYQEYLKKVSTDNTIIIFDTIRPEYFKKIFLNTEIIASEQKKIHSSKRILCKKFII